MNEYLLSDNPVTVTPAPLAVCGAASSFLQSSFWGAFKKQFGWNAYAFTVGFDDREKKPLLVLTRRVARVLTLAYVPWGPELSVANLPFSQTESPTATQTEILTKMMTGIAAGLRSCLPQAALVRFDLPWYTEGTAAPHPAAPFRRASVNVQAPDTVFIDLGPGEEAILAQMKSKWRYNIRLGGKKVTVTRCGPERLQDFYALLEETARRDRIFIHSIAYYQALFDQAAKTAATSDAPSPDVSPAISLYLAEYEAKPVAGIVTLFRGREAVYLYGASSNEHRNLMAPYALQWQAIRDAKAAGCAFYDLFGIPPAPDPSHPMAGLYLFKTGFGGKIVHRPGCYDYVCHPLQAAAFLAAEKARKLFLREKKRAK
ncbi:MAG: peptidoglycan bridge formation glycyltransferase FemA/FemB family protein [Spirochaetaceae bacterium]|jgi:lipid II:glycine glycyltransferase (peptidoglycan interpeptide bridge formation enzyme)|nr:peptidoglycan bridge formation glycyltransferase FemA/FemB family protein [Spirochaetaceae bacterium]